MNALRAKMTEGGRLVVPAEVRRQLGLNPGDSVVLDVRDGELRVRSLRRAVERAQGLVRQYIPQDVCLTEELIAERRTDAARE